MGAIGVHLKSQTRVRRPQRSIKRPIRRQMAEKAPPLQAPGRADAGLVAQQQPDVAGGRLNQHPLADILMATHPHPP